MPENEKKIDDKIIHDIENIFAGPETKGDSKDKEVQKEKDKPESEEISTEEGVITGEESYYGHIEKYLVKKLECFVTWQKTGNRYVGYVDVMGAKGVGEEYSDDIELIAVEVKLSKENFAKSLGQAVGYSLFAHRCYLAIPILESEEKFKLKHKEMAKNLGVGLIEIEPKGACKEILPPEYHLPMDSLIRPFKHLAKVWQDSKGP